MKTRGLFRAVEVLDEMLAAERFAARTIKPSEREMEAYRPFLSDPSNRARRAYESEIYQRAYFNVRAALEIEAHAEPTAATEVIMEMRLGT